MSLLSQAAQVVSSTLKTIISKAVDGASITELQVEGDKLVESGTASLYNKVKGVPKGQSLLCFVALPQVTRGSTRNCSRWFRAKEGSI